MVNRWGVYISGMSLFIFYLIFANNIILCFDRDTPVKKANITEYCNNSEVNYYIDCNENIGGMLEKFYIQGWAYCETEQDNSEKTISLLFKDVMNDRCYEVTTSAQTRHDVYRTFKDTMKIYSSLNGIECQFSTIGIKDGEYELVLYVKENEYNYGLIQTGMYYRKAGEKFVYIG